MELFRSMPAVGRGGEGGAAEWGVGVGMVSFVFNGDCSNSFEELTWQGLIFLLISLL
jgi:hypothetical protein